MSAIEVILCLSFVGMAFVILCVPIASKEAPMIEEQEGNPTDEAVSIALAGMERMYRND